MNEPAVGLGVQEIADLLGVTRQSAYESTRRKSFPAPAMIAGRRRFWDRRDVIEWAVRTRGFEPELEDRLSAIGELVDGLGS